MNDKDLDKLFKEKLENLSVSPRQDLWGKIEENLDKKRARTYARGWLSYAALTIGCLGVTALIYTLLHKTETHTFTQPIAQQERVELPADRGAEEKVTAMTSSNTPITEEVEATAKDYQPATLSVEKTGDKAPSDKLSITTPVLIALEPVSLSTKAITAITTHEEEMDYAIEVPAIQPLIEDPDLEETMLASVRAQNEDIVPNILNKITNALNPSDSTSIQFSKDEEGSLRLDIFNSLVKNRNKKRR